MKNLITLEHCSLKINSSYEAFTSRFEKLAGRIGPKDVENIKSDPKGTEQHLRSLGGYQNLIIFSNFDHGALFYMLGEPKKAKAYQIGNPLIAFSMTKFDLRAALYAPLRVLAYEDNEGTVWFEYDLPSTQFGQFNIDEVTKVGLELDQKLAEVVRKADSKEAI